MAPTAIRTRRRGATSKGSSLPRSPSSCRRSRTGGRLPPLAPDGAAAAPARVPAHRLADPLDALAFLASIANWFSALAIGRSPPPRTVPLGVDPLRRPRLLVRVRRRQPVPGLRRRARQAIPSTSGSIPSPGRAAGSRCFGSILCVPAALVSAQRAEQLFVSAIFGWFVALARGRMPDGLQGRDRLLDRLRGAVLRIPSSSPTATRLEPTGRSVSVGPSSCLPEPLDSGAPGAFV